MEKQAKKGDIVEVIKLEDHNGGAASLAMINLFKPKFVAITNVHSKNLICIRSEGGHYQYNTSINNVKVIGRKKLFKTKYILSILTNRSI